MKKAALKLEKLDTDLKNYKANSIKESIRRGHDDLGDHYLDYGDLSNALKCYSRARDYCTSSKHVIHMCLNVIKVSLAFLLSERYPNSSNGSLTGQRLSSKLVPRPQLRQQGGIHAGFCRGNTLSPWKR